MHILFFSDNFPPEVNAPAQRTFEHCQAWARLGESVTVITCAPNFPNGELIDGYANRIWQEEYIDGIRVIRVWTFIAENSGVIKRTLDYLSFMMSAVIAGLFVRKVDIVIGTSPQFFAACAAQLVGKLKGKPWVFELRDVWPASIHAVGAINKKKFLYAIEKLELFLYRKASVIVSVSSGIQANLIKRGVNPEKIKVITNGFDQRRFYPQPKDVGILRQHSLDEKFIVGYIGTHGLAHGLDTVLDAAKLLADADKMDRYRVIFVGDGAEKRRLAERAGNEDIRNAIFIDAVDRHKVAQYWSILDIAIVHLKKRAIFESVIPSKIFECMAMGIPVLHGVPGVSANLVKANGLGVLFEPENAQELCDELLRLSEDAFQLEVYRSNALAASNEYRRDRLASRLLDELRLASEISESST